MDANRRETLLALLDLASDSSPTSCYDDARAIELLRAQTSAEELRAIGADEGLIEHVFPEPR